MGVALSPTPGLAIAFLLARHLLSQLDVLTRQSFLVLAVEDHERETQVSFTNMSRILTQSTSPTIAGSAMPGRRPASQRPDDSSDGR